MLHTRRPVPDVHNLRAIRYELSLTYMSLHNMIITQGCMLPGAPVIVIVTSIPSIHAT